MRKSIIGFGNPLVDISVQLKKGNQFLQKYGLQPDGQKEISRKEMQELEEDIKGYKQHISPGGCVLNSFRVLKWICQEKCDVFFFGSVGQDPDAHFLNSTLKTQGINARFSVQENLPTGKTVALVNGPSRSLVAHIGAAEVFPLDFIQQEEFNDLFNSSDLVYIESFFLPHREGVGKYLVDLCEEGNKILVFNLCGKYIFDVVRRETIKYLVKYADIVFGNKEEFEALRKLFKQDSFEQMASEIIKSTSYVKFKHKKILLRTDGPHEIVCINEDGQILKVQPYHIEQKEMKDTTGAGDAFIGGFLAGFCFSKGIEESVKLGMYCSKAIIQQIGCTIPNYEPEVNL